MPSNHLKLTLLGSGTSMGVPSLGCHCRVCTSTDPRDNRLRPSLLLSRKGQHVVIDTTPDFRQQALRIGLQRLDAVLFTHAHADHIFGFDDIRPFNMRQNAALPIFATRETFDVLRGAFYYVFDGKPKVSTVPLVEINHINGPIQLLGTTITPIPLVHGDLNVLGFRFGNAAYLTDFSAVPESSFPLLENLDDVILDALRAAPTRVFFPPTAWHAYYTPLNRGSVLAIGNFDGIHLGHQEILRDVARRAAATGDAATALSFEPAPLKILRPDSAPKRLSTNEQRTAWFRVVGLESAVVQAFTLDLSRLSPEEFVQQILVDQLRVRALLVGENFRFGHKQAGDATSLKKLGERFGFEVIVVPPVVYRGEIVSSTLLRREISEGDVSRAGRLLARPFVLTGQVVSGEGIGRRFTVPTLNLHPEQELLPAPGVYITRTLLDGETRSRRSVTNIGMRPTFNGTSLTVGTHLLNAPQEFETKRIEIRFWKRLREEKKFSGPEELRQQIARDIARAHQFFSRLRRFRTAREAAALTTKPLGVSSRLPRAQPKETRSRTGTR